MNYYVFKTESFPKCKICGKFMDYWSPFEKDYEHTGCISKRISKELIKEVKKDLTEKISQS